jgi:hypothetical protein
MATQREVPLSLSIDGRGCHHFATCATEQKAVKPRGNQTSYSRPAATVQAVTAVNESASDLRRERTAPRAQPHGAGRS